MQLFCAFVFAYAKSRFFHDAVHVIIVETFIGRYNFDVQFKINVIKCIKCAISKCLLVKNNELIVMKEYHIHVYCGVDLFRDSLLL